ncbi:MULTISPECIES: hypothetical protein [unclassified Nocardia]|nr:MULTISPECIES: hypothetical protein [unclassified Nocardia]
MNREDRPQSGLFSHLEEPASTSSPTEEEVAASRPVFSSDTARDEHRNT